MALNFPLTTGQFQNMLRVQAARFWLPESLTVERSEGGEIFTSERGPRLWQAEFTLAQGHHANIDEIEARLALLAQPGRSFMAYDPRRTGPKADPDGAGLSGFTPKIGAVTSREVTIAGLPGGYVISRGDYLGWSYGTNPIRHALHRAVSAATADGSGYATIEVVPNIRSGAAVGTAVSLIRPACKMIVVPGSYSPGQASRISTAGASFSAQQTLR